MFFEINCNYLWAWAIGKLYFVCLPVRQTNYSNNYEYFWGVLTQQISYLLMAPRDLGSKSGGGKILYLKDFQMVSVFFYIYFDLPVGSDQKFNSLWCTAFSFGTSLGLGSAKDEA